MALFFECMLQCARKYLTRADIVREAIYQQLRFPARKLAGREYTYHLSER